MSCWSCVVSIGISAANCSPFIFIKNKFVKKVKNWSTIGNMYTRCCNAATISLGQSIHWVRHVLSCRSSGERPRDHHVIRDYVIRDWRWRNVCLFRVAGCDCHVPPGRHLDFSAGHVTGDGSVVSCQTWPSDCGRRCSDLTCPLSPAVDCVWPTRGHRSSLDHCPCWTSPWSGHWPSRRGPGHRTRRSSRPAEAEHTTD